MDHYIEIKLTPDTEMRGNFLLNRVYTELHKALFDLNNKSIGISFPDYQILLGRRIRLHGNAADLEKLQSLNWLGSLLEYCEGGNIKEIPKKVQYRIISRKRTKMDQSNLNRLIKRGSIKPEEIRAYKAKMFSQGLDNPYVELISGSNGHQHRRYIEFSELQSNFVEGEFDHFGLSRTATVPWF